jgi:hypothetical protein
MHLSKAMAMAWQCQRLQMAWEMTRWIGPPMDGAACIVHRVASCQGEGWVGQRRRRDAGPIGGSGPYWRTGSIPGPPVVSGGVGLAILARDAQVDAAYKHRDDAP